MNRDEAIDIIRDAGFGFLATTEDNQPHVRPMMPYYTEDGQLLVALLGRSRTISEIQKNPMVEICYVDRKMWYCRVTGKAKLSEDQSKKEILWENIPMLRQYFGGSDDPNFKLLEIEIIKAEGMTPHQKQPENVQL
jgi:general stress protein 26